MPIEQSILVSNSYFGEVGANKVSLCLPGFTDLPANSC